MAMTTQTDYKLYMGMQQPGFSFVYTGTTVVTGSDPLSDAAIERKLPTLTIPTQGNPSDLQALNQLFSKVVLLKKSTLTPDQQASIYLTRYNDEVKIVKELKERHLVDLRKLRGDSWSNGTIQAVWNAYQKIAESEGMQPIGYVPGETVQISFGGPTNVQSSRNLYFDMNRQLCELVGDHYDGTEASIDSNSAIGKCNAKLLEIATKYNDQAKFETLIRSLEAQHNSD